MEGWTSCSAKVQIGAELLCKSAKVNLGVGAGKYFQMSRGRDVITIASALAPDGCDVIASLPKASTPPILYTQYWILLPHICTFAQAVGRLALLHRRLVQASASSSNAIGSAGGRSMDLTAKPGMECRIQVNNIGMLCTTVKTKMDSRPSRNVWISAMKKTRYR